jgi:hypothetical protein
MPEVPEDSLVGRRGAPAGGVTVKRTLTARRFRYTGPSRKMRALVLKRDSWRCACCGRDVSDGWPYSIQHRVARGSGGRNTPENLVTMCGSATSPGCHRRAEDRDDGMHMAGFWLYSWENPASVPVTVLARGGMVTVLLAADGTYGHAEPA